jgi:TPR repeat protein
MSPGLDTIVSQKHQEEAAANKRVDDARNAIKRRDYEAALSILRPLADEGNPRAQNVLGFMYSKGQGVQHDEGEAVRWFRHAAEKGLAAAQFNLGLHLEEGRGISQDYKGAAKWYRLAAEQTPGHLSAQIHLGALYETGKGVPVDYAEAAKWYTRAAERDSPTAQTRLAALYFDGKGVRKDYAEAARLYSLAAHSGDRSAQELLAKMYFEGTGIAKDIPLVIDLLRAAASQGSVFAQGALGAAYLDGKGVTQSYLQAHMWFNVAASSADRIGEDMSSFVVERRNRVATMMTASQVAFAQEKAAHCIATKFTECDEPPSTWATTPTKGRVAKGTIPLKKRGGTFVVPVQISASITLDFIVDSGAADVTIPADVLTTLMRAGVLTKSDFLGKNTYVLADGTEISAPTYMIKSLKVGDRVVENVKVGATSSNGDPLLGQSFFNRFKSWSIDNARQELILE